VQKPDLNQTNRTTDSALEMTGRLLPRLAVVALLLALTLPRMAQRGMFSDGLLHATIARNMAIGVGSLWAPNYTQTAWIEYYEHPPLGLALEAVAFHVLGDHLSVERFFSLLVLALHGGVIAGIWRRLRSAPLDWLAVLFWLTPSIVSWGAVNNMLENTQALLTTTAVLLLLDATRASTAAATAIGSTVAGVTVVAAVLTKGPAGFFPLVAPLVFGWLLLPPAASAADRRRRALAVLTPIFVVLVACALLAAYEPSRHNLTMYVRTQLAPSLLGRREVSESWGIVRHLLIGIDGRMAALLGLCWLASRTRGSLPTAAAGHKAAGAFMLLGACAAGPFAFSPRLSGHYLLPAVPMFALGFASLAAAFVDARVRKTLIVVTLLAVVVLAAGRRRRDDALIRDLGAIEDVMPRAVLMGACPHPRAARDWELHSYVQRWYRVSLDARAQPVNGWFLQSDAACAVPESCTPAAGGVHLRLFRCGH
jgi:4-amino-4-deoxy-L-arabinose transferase-like glycosyltransferase